MDTSGWAAWLNRRERFQTPAVAVFEDVWQQGDELQQTNWVLAEFTAFLTRPLRLPKPQQIRLLHDIRTDSGVIIVVAIAASIVVHFTHRKSFSSD